MLQVTHLSCQRGRRVLFSALNFELHPGQCLWVRGANGVGKTTLLRCLCGLSQPSEGHILWQARSLAQASELFHQNLLYLGHQNAVKEDLSPLENLQLQEWGLGWSVGSERLHGALRELALQGREHLACRYLSQGQKRRVALARLALSRHPLWVLDEPFVALDDKAMAWLGQRLLEHLANGGMVVLTSHQAWPALLTPSSADGSAVPLVRELDLGTPCC